MVDHRTGQFDAGDRYAAFGERNGHPSGPDGELQRRPTGGECGEAVDGWPEDLGREHSAARGVVTLGAVGVPDLLLSHAANDRGPSTALSIEFAKELAGVEYVPPDLDDSGAAPATDLHLDGGPRRGSR
ncbi:hypothetical protein [Plantactinospora mayteni]|uniref:hypothetical protein n=1 Tax=Plantactinospora mayteni TaxID=566021 RepID=UPI001EF69974|nr:hypothetical protein [Plantactinospora mayteni]